MSLWRLCAGVLLMCSVLSGSDAALDAATEGNWTFPCCHITGGDLTYIPRINITCDCLNFSNNTLTNITNETFKNITFVKSLILHKDKIRNISSYAFRNLTSLKYLDLQYNFIYPRDLVIAFQSLHHNIQIINLSRNILKRFNGFVDVLIGKNITTLTLERCRIEQKLNFSELSFLKPLRVLSMGYNVLYTTTGHVPSHLTNITLRDNYLRHLPRFCSNHTKVSQLRYLDLRDNNIFLLPRHYIECLTSLEYLYITYNRVTAIGSSTFTSLPRLGFINLENVFENANGHLYSYAFNNSVIKSLILKSLTPFGSFTGIVDPACLGGCGGLLELSLSNNDMADANNTFFDTLLGNLNTVQTLSLAHCQLYFLPKVVSNLLQLQMLDVHGNRILLLEDGMFDNLKNLKSIDVSKNALLMVLESVFPLNLRNQLVTVKLEYNSYICKCVNLWFIEWVLRSGKFSNRESYRCGYPPNLQSISIFDAGVSEQHCRMSPLTFPIIFGLSVPTLVLLILISLAYRWRWHIRYYVFMLRFKKRNNEDVQMTFTFDAFVLYCDEDSSWVRHHLLPSVEADDSLQLCIHERNFTPGRYIVDNIMDNLENSRKVVLVLSNNFSQSPWCQFELTLVQKRALEREFYVVVIVLEEMDDRYMTSSLYALLQTTTYIKWPGEEEHRCMFWTRLKQCLQQ